MPNDSSDCFSCLETCLLAFQASLQRGEKPDLVEFLPDGDERLAYLFELVHAELRFRTRAGETVCARDYLQKFPELAEDPDALGSLLELEADLDQINDPHHPVKHKNFRKLKIRAQQCGPSSGFQHATSLPGYQILEELGRGGMGVVVRALDLQLNRQVAIKLMSPTVAANPSARERFSREARAVASLTHEHVVTIFQVGEHDQVPFIVMPLLQGESLSTRLKRGPRLSVAEALRIARETAEGLAAAHGIGLMHRDIKPANLWLEAPEAKVKIFDFGLSRHVGDQQLTHLGLMMGTPAYMAPEQAAAKEMDFKVDLFSLGCVLYEMLVGKRAFQGSDIISVLNEIANYRPLPLHMVEPAISAELSILVTQLLEKDCKKRLGSAADLAKTLRTLESRLSNPTSLPGWKRVAFKKFRHSALFGILPALLLLMGLGYAYVYKGQSGQSSELPGSGDNANPTNPHEFTGITITAGGSTFVNPLIQHWGEIYEKEKGVRIHYQGVGCGKGIKSMIQRDFHFGCTDAFMNEAEMAEADKCGGKVIHIPLMIGAVVPAYHLDGIKEPLKFTGKILADIYLGKITHWDDQSLKIHNPLAGLTHKPITVVHRADSSGTTYIWTDYLSKTNPDWKQEVNAGKEIKWLTGTSVIGHRGMVEKIGSTDGSLGYLELTYAIGENLSFGTVRNKEDKFILASPESVRAAVEHTLENAMISDDLHYSLTDAPGPKSYPITGTTWATLYLDQTHNPAAAEMIEFLHWATHDGQVHLRNLMFVELPSNLVQKIDDRLAQVRYSNR